MQQLDGVLRQAMARVFPADNDADRTAISVLLGSPPPPRPQVGNPFVGGIQAAF